MVEETQDYVDEEPTVTPETIVDDTNTTDVPVEENNENKVDTTEPTEQESDIADLSDINSGNDASLNPVSIVTVPNVTADILRISLLAVLVKHS